MAEIGIEPARADAQHNRRAILVAAREAARGDGEIWLDRIAQSAGVSARTLYRHFPTKDDLIAGVLEDYFAEHVEQIHRRAEAETDARRALETVLASAVGAFADYPGILALVNRNARAGEIAGRYLRSFGEVLSRAQQVGAVRADLQLDELPCLVTMLVAVAGTTGERWTRYLELLLDGLSPVAARAPLPDSGVAHGHPVQPSN